MLALRFVRGLSPVAASGGHSSSRCGDRSSSRCAGHSPPRPLPSRGTGSRRAGPAIAAHGPSRSAARGILPDQGPNPRPPHQQADSQPLRHQGSPTPIFERAILSPLTGNTNAVTDDHVSLMSILLLSLGYFVEFSSSLCGAGIFERVFFLYV